MIYVRIHTLSWFVLLLITLFLLIGCQSLTIDKTKEEMISTIHKTFDETIALISKFDISKLNDRLDYLGLNRTKRQIFLLLTDHITHHRGQMLVSLRLNGLVPPRYIFYQ